MKFRSKSGSFALVCGAVLAVVANCGKSDSRSVTAQRAANRLEIFVDDTSVATVQAKDIESWPRLDTVVPVSARRLGTWAVVKIVGRSPAELSALSATYPDLIPALFPGVDAQPAFGMFDPVELAKRGRPVVRHDHVREVRIALTKDSGRGEHEQGEGGGRDPLQLRLTVKSPAGTTVLTGATVLALPRDNMPGTADPKGWTLQKILGAAGVKTFETLVLSDARGTALNVDKSAFDGARSIPYVKLNRQGLLRLRIFQKQGENWNPTGGDLREFTAIEVTK